MALSLSQRAAAGTSGQTTQAFTRKAGSCRQTWFPKQSKTAALRPTRLQALAEGAIPADPPCPAFGDAEVRTAAAA